MDVQVQPAHHTDDMATPTAAQFDPSVTQQATTTEQRELTPTNPRLSRGSFSLAEKRPLSPQRPSTSTSLAPPGTQGDLSRQESLQSLRSNDTRGSSNAGAVDEALEGSENEKPGDTYPPQKKKKSQRFYCTDYPPCNLSFTRSEHLARHIRHVRFETFPLDPR